VVAAADKERALKLLRDHHEEPVVVGGLTDRKASAPALEVEGADGAWLMLPELGVSLPFPEVLSSLQDPWTISRKKLVALGGREEVTTLPALAQALALPASAAELCAVVSPYADSSVLTHARNVGIKDVVLGAGKFTSTDFFCDGLDMEEKEPELSRGYDDDVSAATDFSRRLDELMSSMAADYLVILDDMDLTLLTRQLLQRYTGKILIVHASLLPAFPGPAPIQAALRSGVCITGCTVSFAAPSAALGAKSCHGPMILQEATKVHANDTVASLRARLVAECETFCVSRAVQLVASGSVALRADDGGFSLGRSASFTEAASDEMLGSSLTGATLELRDALNV
jgi:folate-dependent phosphoribosylglycinamide formyltransferase PurN